jgi:hypothetical protein
MEITFKAKLLQYFACKNEQTGFIWLKLIFALIFLAGAAIFFGSFFLGSVNKCSRKNPKFEVKNNLGVINRSQQAYFVYYGTFAKSIQELQISIKEQTENYTYSIRTEKNSVFQYAIARRKTVSNGWFDSTYLTSYVGAVFIHPHIKNSDGKSITISIVCENNSPGSEYPSLPTLKNGVPICGIGTQSLHQI